MLFKKKTEEKTEELEPSNDAYTRVCDKYMECLRANHNLLDDNIKLAQANHSLRKEIENLKQTLEITKKSTVMTNETCAICPKCEATKVQQKHPDELSKRFCSSCKVKYIDAVCKSVYMPPWSYHFGRTKLFCDNCETLRIYFNSQEECDICNGKGIVWK